jgi:hypothetical protein
VCLSPLDFSSVGRFGGCENYISNCLETCDVFFFLSYHSLLSRALSFSLSWFLLSLHLSRSSYLLDWFSFSQICSVLSHSSLISSGTHTSSHSVSVSSLTFNTCSSTLMSTSRYRLVFDSTISF